MTSDDRDTVAASNDERALGAATATALRERRRPVARPRVWLSTDLAAPAPTAAPRAPAPAARPTVAPWWRDDDALAIWAFLGSVFTVLATAVAATLVSARDLGRGPWPGLPTSTTGVFEALGRWDAAWYVRLAGAGYPDPTTFEARPRLAAFYPVLPGLLRAVSTATGLPPVVAGCLVGLAGGAAAVLVVRRLTAEIAGPAAGRRAAVLLAWFPASFVFVLPYTEGLAIALVGGALLAARRDRWVLAGVLGALATATRPNTVVVVVALAVAAWPAWRSGRDAARRAWLAPILAAGGVAAVWFMLFVRTGHPLAWLHAEKVGWADRSDLGVTTVRTVWGFVTDPAVSLGSTGLVPLALTVGSALTLVGLVCLWRWRPPAPVAVYGVGAIALAVASSVVGPRPRMLLGAFPLVMAVAVRVRGRAFGLLVACSAVLLVLLSWVTFTTVALAP